MVNIHYSLPISYATLAKSCAIGISFNCSVFPYYGHNSPKWITARVNQMSDFLAFGSHFRGNATTFRMSCNNKLFAIFPSYPTTYTSIFSVGLSFPLSSSSLFFLHDENTVNMAMTAITVENPRQVDPLNPI